MMPSLIDRRGEVSEEFLTEIKDLSSANANNVISLQQSIALQVNFDDNYLLFSLFIYVVCFPLDSLFISHVIISLPMIRHNRTL